MDFFTFYVQYKVCHYLMEDFQLSCPLLFVHFFWKWQITRSCLIFFWGGGGGGAGGGGGHGGELKINFLFIKVETLSLGICSSLFFILSLECCSFFVIFFNLSLGCRRTCFTNSSSFFCFKTLASLSLGWSGTFLWRLHHHIYFFIIFCADKLPLSF